MNAVFLDEASLYRDDLDLSVLRATVDNWRFYEQTAPNQVLERIRDAEIVVTNKVRLDASVLEQSKRLKLICVAATGTNNVDLDAASRCGIAVCNARGYATPSVVQHVFVLMLALTTRLLDYRQAVSRGDWQNSREFCLLDFPIRELSGKTLGIIGYGELGRAVADIASVFGMQIMIAVRPGTEAGSESRPEANQAERIALANLLPQVDVLSLHCPLTEATRGLIGAHELALMKPGALLINTARGGIVDEVALADALIKHRIGGAGVDVLTTEPPTDGNPLLDPNIPNLIVTPHIAWASRESRQCLIAEIALNIQAYTSGELRNTVKGIDI